MRLGQIVSVAFQLDPEGPFGDVLRVPIRAMKIGLVALLLLPVVAWGQDKTLVDRRINFPDTENYKSLVCDLHMHTVFSDGSVWPDIRVQEAVAEGLDCIAVTEHLEYLPHLDDIPFPDRNKPYRLARDMVPDSVLIILPGSEITRRMPPGHSNAIFLNDANKLLIDDSLNVFREARRQGAFVFWNHPNWEPQQPDGIATLQETHHTLLKENLLQGIEVVNDVTYSDEALQIALDHDLTIIGTSDIHGLVDWQFGVGSGGHRPVTIVLAEERSVKGIRDGLFDRRTIVWFNELLIGREEHVLPLVQSSLQVVDAIYRPNTTVLNLRIENKSDVEFSLKNLSPFTFHNFADIVTIAPNDTTSLLVKTIDDLDDLELQFEVQNVVTAPGEHPTLEIPVTVLRPDEDE